MWPSSKSRTSANETARQPNVTSPTLNGSAAVASELDGVPASCGHRLSRSAFDE